jgi:hypothetical protein
MIDPLRTGRRFSLLLEAITYSLMFGTSHSCAALRIGRLAEGIFCATRSILESCGSDAGH